MEQPIASLNLSTEDHQKLKTLGFNYVHELHEDTVDKNKVQMNPDEWKKLTYIPQTKTALDIYYETNQSGTIYTFNKQLDTLLENEIVSGNILELCGEAGSGKTQICFQLCVSVQLPQWLGGKNGGALYLCTNYNFSTQRIQELSQTMIDKISLLELPCDKKSVTDMYTVDHILKNIHHIQIDTYDEFLATVIYLKKWLQHNNIRLLIIDSLTPIIQQIDFKEKRQFIYKIFADLQKLALDHDFVIIVTNNITIRMKAVNDIYKTPALGEAYYHRINSRIHLRKLSNNCFRATLEKSITKSECTVLFHL